MSFSKALDQNFLINPSVCPRMADMCGADENTGVIEIGAGVGVLTAELAKREPDCYVKKALEAEEAILRIIIDDNNFGGFNHDMFSISMKRAELAVADNNYEEAVKQLEKAKQKTSEQSVDNKNADGSNKTDTVDEP